MKFDVDYVIALIPILLPGLLTTLKMAGIGIIFALILAIIVAIIRVNKIPVLDPFCQLYISFFRGTPLMVQLFILYYGLPRFFPLMINIDGVTAVIIGLSLHFAAYMSESIRAAIIGIDHSQVEASYSIGMTRMQSMRRIILPQATRVALPSLMNQFIDMVKSTSLAFTLGVAEMMSQTQIEASSSFLYFEAFTTVALIYWVIVILMTMLQNIAEKKLNKAYQR